MHRQMQCQTSRLKYDNSECDTFKSYNIYSLLCVSLFFYSVEVSAYNTEKKCLQRKKSSCAYKKFSMFLGIQSVNGKCKNIHTHTTVRFSFFLQCNCTTLSLYNFNTFTLTGFFALCLMVSLYFECCVCIYKCR